MQRESPCSTCPREWLGVGSGCPVARHPSSSRVSGLLAPWVPPSHSLYISCISVPGLVLLSCLLQTFLFTRTHSFIFAEQLQGVGPRSRWDQREPTPLWAFHSSQREREREGQQIQQTSYSGVRAALKRENMEVAKTRWEGEIG